MTVSEEREQVFSKISRYGYTTKHMRKQGLIALVNSGNF